MNIDQTFASKCKLDKNIVDYLNILYKPVYQPLRKSQNQSDDEFEVAEEYNSLVFYVTKARNLFAALSHAVKMALGDSTELHTKAQWDSAADTIQGYLAQIVGTPTFMWLKSISEIPPDTEFTYLGEIDSLILMEELSKLDAPFKQLVSAILTDRT
jgi:hypothetical protein